jgi:hypothetical protein
VNIEEAREICRKMHGMDHRNPTDEQRKAKNMVYDHDICPQYDGDPPPHLEPDYMEGWKSI